MKTPRFTRWFSRHAERRIRGHFRAVELAGLDALDAALAGGPVLVVANHSSWWDALWIIALAHRLLRADGYALMDAANLERFPFFARVGALGVDRSDPRDGARALRHAARCLDRAGRLLFVFPQGEERASSLRPLGFSAGSAMIARRAPAATVLPMGIRYEHGREERPTLLASIGAPLAAGHDAAAQEAAVIGELDRIAAHLVQADARFQTYWPARPSVLARWAERMLVWLTRP